MNGSKQGSEEDGVCAMYIIAKYSHKDGDDFILRNHPQELDEIKQVIAQVDATRFKTKRSREKTMPGRMLYSPIKLNMEFKRRFEALGWKRVRMDIETAVPEIERVHKGYREMDLVKNRLGLEVQFGKYAFMVYNILAKMTIFAKQGIIDSGVEVVSMLDLASEMSTGVSYFEQVKGDLEYRGESNIDIPILILGVDAVKRPYRRTSTI